MRSEDASAESVRKELDFYLALGPAVAATDGDATPETLRVFYTLGPFWVVVVLSQSR